MFSNTLFFLNEIDYDDYNEYYFIPGVGVFLELAGECIDDDSKLKDGVVDVFLDKVIVRAKTERYKDKKLKKFTIDKIAEKPYFSIANEYGSLGIPVVIHNM